MFPRTNGRGAPERHLVPPRQSTATATTGQKPRALRNTGGPGRHVRGGGRAGPRDGSAKGAGRLHRPLSAGGEPGDSGLHCC